MTAMLRNAGWAVYKRKARRAHMAAGGAENQPREADRRVVHPSAVRSYDVVEDRTHDRRNRMLDPIDEFTRKRLVIRWR